MAKKINFLNLGKHPITNNFLKVQNPNNEYFYDLDLIFNSETKLVSLKKFVSPKRMFNDKYAHRASASKTMRLAYSKLAKSIKKKFKPKSILEIGSNDGVFIKHFNKINNIGVEPCKNLARITNKMKIKTYDEFWNMSLSKKIMKHNKFFDVIYSANTISHIHNLDETFQAVKNSLNNNGIFILEDPSLAEVLKNRSYDQFYDEHAYVFSITALKNITKKVGLQIFNIEKLKTHGGSNRVYFKKFSNDKIKISNNVSKHLKNENGATYKSSTVLNYCNLNHEFIDYFLDTTPTKVGKFTPGTHIPIMKYNGIPSNVRFAFLGAWNFKEEIFKKEKEFIKRGGKFISHVPYPKIL